MTDTSLAIADETAQADEALRAATKTAKEADRKSWANFAKAAGVAQGTLTSWMSGGYNGGKRPVEMTEKLELYLQTREARLKTNNADPGFVETPTSTRIFTLLQDAQFGPDMVSISGNPGTGKTIALKEYRRTHSNVWLVTMRPTIKSPYTLMARIADVMEVEEKAVGKVTDSVGVRSENTGGLVIIDEAQHLTALMLDELRYVYDIYDIGIVLTGNLALHGHLIGGKNGKSRKPAFAQFYSRLGFRAVFDKPTDDDIDLVIAAWGIEDPEAAAPLRKIAEKAGGLREVVKTIKSAIKAARGLGQSVDGRLVKAAWAHRDHEEN